MGRLFSSLRLLLETLLARRSVFLTVSMPHQFQPLRPALAVRLTIPEHREDIIGPPYRPDSATPRFFDSALASDATGLKVIFLYLSNTSPSIFPTSTLLFLVAFVLVRARVLPSYCALFSPENLKVRKGPGSFSIDVACSDRTAILRSKRARASHCWLPWAC